METSNRKVLIWLIVIGVLISIFGIFYIIRNNNSVEDENAKTHKKKDSLLVIKNQKRIEDSLVRVREQEERIRKEKIEEENRLEKIEEKEKLNFNKNREFAKKLFDEAGVYILMKGIAKNDKIDVSNISQSISFYQTGEKNLNGFENSASEKDELLKTYKEVIYSYLTKLINLYIYIGNTVDEYGNYYTPPDTENKIRADWEGIKIYFSILNDKTIEVGNKYEIGK